jgi:putative membrane protein
MAQLLLRWFLSALLLVVVSLLVPGFEVAGLRAALFAALVIGLVNATLGLFLKIITFPLTILTFGIFLLVINALMLMFVSTLVRGFMVHSFGAAFFGAFLLAVLGVVTKWFTAGAR